jgi:hypothetical protein
LLFVLVISRVWKKSEFCCLFYLYTEPERRVSFKQQNTLLFQALYITKTNNKTHSSFRLCIWTKQTTKLTLLLGSVYNQNKQQNSLCFGYIQKLKEECVLLFVLVIYRAWKRSVFCCLFCLYTEPERRVNNKTHSSFRLCI